MTVGTDAMVVIVPVPCLKGKSERWWVVVLVESPCGFGKGGGKE